ncbi:cyanophycinase [candidate division KSB1 bacterium]
MKTTSIKAVLTFFALSLVFCGEKAPRFGPANGSLVIVGGGASTEIREKFIELAGGNDAPIVIVPTAGGQETYADSAVISSWERMGCTSVTMLHTTDRAEADTEEFISNLRAAAGVWFNGGRQWRLVDAYMNTLTYYEFHKVLERGGVIGGSSAGATIQGSFLARGAESGNTLMIAPIPEHRGGFGFLKNSAIDQHIDARNRWKDLYEIILEFPELLGIGISERTAIVVRGDVFEVIGVSQVAIHDAARTRTFTDVDTVFYYTLNPGDRYDIKNRTVTYRAPQDSTAHE